MIEALAAHVHLCDFVPGGVGGQGAAEPGAGAAVVGGFSRPASPLRACGCPKLGSRPVTCCFAADEGRA